MQNEVEFEIIELGVASEETKGQPGLIVEDFGGDNSQPAYVFWSASSRARSIWRRRIGGDDD